MPLSISVALTSEYTRSVQQTVDYCISAGLPQNRERPFGRQVVGLGTLGRRVPLLRRDWCHAHLIGRWRYSGELSTLRTRIYSPTYAGMQSMPMTGREAGRAVTLRSNRSRVGAWPPREGNVAAIVMESAAFCRLCECFVGENT